MIFNNVSFLVSRAHRCVTITFQDSGFRGGNLYPTMHPLFVAEVLLAEISTVLNYGGIFVPINIVSYFPWGISESQSNHPTIDCAGDDTGKPVRDKYLSQLQGLVLFWVWIRYDSSHTNTQLIILLALSRFSKHWMCSIGRALSWMYPDNISINSVSRFSFAYFLISVQISGLACRKCGRLSLAEFTGKKNFRCFRKWRYQFVTTPACVASVSPCSLIIGPRHCSIVSKSTDSCFLSQFGGRGQCIGTFGGVPIFGVGWCRVLCWRHDS